ncbi:alpha/beta fold hydrolase [Nonomuraea jiangxiensis]|uniref:Pimeloyl-ACP methyl ester carboxylesterase n=1 Tax=Nonomuraea jiangxiensis TaxID=633440 RepID=A0A1G8TMQ6_9ACTN|nr:alpha/beta hydrolase [Nonomuraea jiangxiensis]SDJ42205.1 Pimeloyl-ACP methyl ester carboxylesterase [Nonomuraea jiangxiensis]
MKVGGVRGQVGRFTSPDAERKFLAAYERAMSLWPQPYERLDVETSYGTTRVYRYGTAPAEPIVLLHGHGANASNWYPQITPLGREHPVYAIDTIDDPGGSRQRTPVTGSRDAAAWLTEVLAGLGLRRVHLVGLSYGAWLALNQGIYDPDRLATLTLLDPGGLEKVRLRFMADMLVGALAMALAPRRWRPALGRSLNVHALVERAEIMKPVMIGARFFRPDRSPARPFTDDELQRVTVPVQLIVGERSTLLQPRRALARASALLPVVRAEILPDVGHAVPLERPDLVNARILAFVKGSAVTSVDD